MPAATDAMRRYRHDNPQPASRPTGGRRGLAARAAASHELVAFCRLREGQRKKQRGGPLRDSALQGGFARRWMVNKLGNVLAD